MFSMRGRFSKQQIGITDIYMWAAENLMFVYGGIFLTNPLLGIAKKVLKSQDIEEH